MARIEGIKHRLERWAKWCSYREGGSLGYSKINLLARGGVRGTGHGAGGAAADQDVEAAETNDAVESLRFTQSHLHMVLTLYYAKSLPLHEVAKRVCRAESTVKRNLEDADHALQAWLHAKAELARANWRGKL